MRFIRSWDSTEVQIVIGFSNTCRRYSFNHFGRTFHHRLLQYGRQYVRHEHYQLSDLNQLRR